MNKDNEGDIEFIEALAKLLNEKDLAEIEVLREYDKNKVLEVRLSKTAPQAQIQYAAPSAPMAAPAAPAASAAPAPSADTSVGQSALELTNAETSPMVGTVYLSPEPGAAPFAKQGDTVEKGQTVLIIEAMKTMNQIPASRSGTITRILVEDGTPVEFGDPLVIIE